MTYKTIIYLLLIANACSVGLNVAVVIMNYNREVPIISWEWNALAVLVSTISFIWILSWGKG